MLLDIDNHIRNFEVSFNLLTPQELAPFLFGPPALMSFLGCLVLGSQWAREVASIRWASPSLFVKKAEPPTWCFATAGKAGEDMFAKYPARLRMFSLFGYLWGGERLYRISSCNLFSFLAAFLLRRRLYL